jgi:hypothetical protein
VNEAVTDILLAFPHENSTSRAILYPIHPDQAIENGFFVELLYFTRDNVDSRESLHQNNSKQTLWESRYVSSGEAITWIIQRNEHLQLDWFTSRTGGVITVPPPGLAADFLHL